MNIKDIKTIQLVKPCSTLPQLMVGDELVRDGDTFVYDNLLVHDSSLDGVSAQSRISVVIPESLFTELRDCFKAIKVDKPKKYNKQRELINRLSIANQDLEAENAVLGAALKLSKDAMDTVCDNGDIKEKIKALIEDYQTAFDELYVSEQDDEFTDEALTVYRNLIIVLEELLK